MKKIKSEKCHGCNGKGWVDSQYKGAQVCPVCNGSGVAPESYPKPIVPFSPNPYEPYIPPYTWPPTPYIGDAPAITWKTIPLTPVVDYNW